MITVSLCPISGPKGYRASLAVEARCLRRALEENNPRWARVAAWERSRRDAYAEVALGQTKRKRTRTLSMFDVGLLD